MSKLVPDYEIEIKNRVWSVFNHAAWHSVHAVHEVKQRINVGIDFASLTVEEFLPILHANSKTVVPENLL